MADNDLNQNQQPPAAPAAGYASIPISKPKIIDPLDEPLLDDSQPKHILVQGAQSVPPISSQPSSSDIKVGSVGSNTFQPLSTAAIPIGQFKLPSEELIAEEKQKIQPASPSPLPIQNKINSVPPNLLHQPPASNQKPISKNSVPPINIVPKKKKQSFLKIFLLIILMLIVILGALVGITYAGIEIPFVSKFISQYLPISNQKDFTKSMANAQDAVNQATSYSVATTINLGEATSSSPASSSSELVPGTPPVLPGVAAGDTTDSQVAWNNMILSVYGIRQADGKMLGTISIAPANTGSQTSIFQVSYDFALDEKLLYLHPLGLFDANTANWQAIDLKEVERNQSLAALLKILDLKKLLPMFEAGEWQATEGVTIKSRASKDLGTITANKFNITTTNVGSSSIGGLESILYIAENEPHPVKATATASIKDQSGATVPAKIESYFFNYNVDQKVSIPKKADYVMITLDTFLSSNGFYSGTTIPDTASQEADARDNIRKADIDKLVQALEKYQTDKNTYPITSRIEKTNESETLKEALVPDYLDSLPVDPLDPNYWYGYNSDGYTYHITSIIEGFDASAKQGARVKYQEIIK